MLEGELYHLLTQLPLTVEERSNLVAYSGSFLPAWYRAGVVCAECLPIFGTYSIGFILGSDIFHGLNALRKLKSKQSLSIHQFIFESSRGGYIKDSIHKMNNGQANL